MPNKVLPQKPEMLRMSWVEPFSTNSKYEPRIGIIDQFIPSRKRKKLEEANRLFEADHQLWRNEVNEIARKNDQIQRRYEDQARKSEEEFQSVYNYWVGQRQEFLKQQDDRNEAIVNRKKEYFASVPEAIVEYSELVLTFSRYPEYFPRDLELDYNPETKMLVVD